MFQSVLKRMKKKVCNRAWFKRDFISFTKKNDGRFVVDWESRFPCFDDRTDSTIFDVHYIYHPAWAARILSKTNPSKHIDISSTLNFSTMVSAFIPVEFYDFRPVTLSLSKLLTGKTNLFNLQFPSDSIKSLSCMHTVEHIGLGRYGDPLDSEGDLKAIDELKRVLAPGGDLLFVVPIGKPKIVFNAHRIYSYKQIAQYFSELKLCEFSLVTDKGTFVEGANMELANEQNYGCGCFWFKK